MGVLHLFRRGWVVRVVIGGCMLGLGRVGVVCFVGESVCGVVVLRWRDFLVGFGLR